MPKPPHSAYRRGSPQRIGSVLAERFPDHWQDPDAEAFGWEIVRALGYPDDQHNVTVRSEWGAFASWWSRVKKAAPAMVQDELWAVAVKKAVYVCKKAKTAKNRSAVWFHIMAGEFSHRGIRLPPVRAG